jgi:ribosomal protein L17
MRHRKAGRKLGRNSSHRKAMFRNMVTSLLRHDQIRTTLPKAKELRQHVEPVITLARKHAWSNYQGQFTELQGILSGLDGKINDEETKAALAIVLQSSAKVTGRFPSGLGRLSSLLQKQGDEFSEQVAVILRIREVQMARQHAIVQAKSTVSDTEVLEKLFGELAETFKTRNGGYTRVIKDGHREGDNANMAFICLVLEELEQSEEAPTEINEEVAE